MKTFPIPPPPLTKALCGSQDIPLSYEWFSEFCRIICLRFTFHVLLISFSVCINESKFLKDRKKLKYKQIPSKYRTENDKRKKENSMDLKAKGQS